MYVAKSRSTLKKYIAKRLGSQTKTRNISVILMQALLDCFRAKGLGIKQSTLTFNNCFKNYQTNLHLQSMAFPNQINKAEA